RQVFDPATNTAKWAWRFSGNAFGVDGPNESPAGGAAYALNLRFPGQHFDSETGLNYNYFRDYESTAGRYVQSDPIGLRSDLNTYRYAYSNPLIVFDRNGLESWFCRRPMRGLSIVPHHYICVTRPDGTSECGGQAPKPSCGLIGGMAGCEGSDSNEKFTPSQCTSVGDNRCQDSCFVEAMSQPRPKYGIGPQGTDCQEWVDEIRRDCAFRCNMPVPLN
ncbi:MAG: RHS repeat-associated core domain-containing protein, partial [Dokdonella sp.]|nr:RHS repeat-associated core domain-containing protein [Dokdonella sp.]